MLKEIFEQKNAIYATVAHAQHTQQFPFERIGQNALRALAQLTLVGCGSSWHAARIGQFFFEHIAQIPTNVVLASEYRYMPMLKKDGVMALALSQSGETADTLEVVRLLHTIGMPTVGLTNVASSSLTRLVDDVVLTYAGQEISVASTKAFSTQLAALYMIAHHLAYQRGLISDQDLVQSYTDILLAAEVLEQSIERYRLAITNHAAARYACFDKFIFLGRHISYPFAMEAALKLKEVSYIFAQCYPAGELKHGPIALVDERTPVMLFSVLDDLIYQKLLSNAQQVKARQGHLVVFAFEGQDELLALADYAFIVPRVNPLLAPLAMTGLMQFFVYHIARVLDCPIDKPRNLAKSVTVE